MEKDEEWPDSEREEESGRRAAASESPISSGPWSGSAGQAQSEGSGGYTQTALISVAAVAVGVALFVAGFFTHSLLEDDVDLDPVNEALATLNQQTGEIQDILGGAVGDGASPTPAPVVAATADDDPFIGPEDASVTIIGFTDYQ
jgi:hypothetical protein